MECVQKNITRFGILNKKIMVIDGQKYTLNQVDAIDGLDMVNKLKPLQCSRYFDKIVYRTGNNIAMACYANDVDNNWNI